MTDSSRGGISPVKAVRALMERLGRPASVGAGLVHDRLTSSLCDICAVEVLGYYRLRPTFTYGLAGNVDLSHLGGWKACSPPFTTRGLRAGAGRS